MQASPGIIKVQQCVLNSGDIKPLRGTNGESLRLRIGGYRVIYRVENDTIIIDKVDSRGDVYK